MEHGKKHQKRRGPQRRLVKNVEAIIFDKFKTDVFWKTFTQNNGLFLKNLQNNFSSLNFQP